MTIFGALCFFSELESRTNSVSERNRVNHFFSVCESSWKKFTCESFSSHQVQKTRGSENVSENVFEFLERVREKIVSLRNRTIPRFQLGKKNRIPQKWSFLDHSEIYWGHYARLFKPRKVQNQNKHKNYGKTVVTYFSRRKNGFYSC